MITKNSDLSDIHLEKRIPKIRLIVFDFDGVFTNNMVYVFQNGYEAVRCSRGDGIGLKKLRQIGIEAVVISTETNPVVSARCNKLGVRCFQGCEDKRKILEDISREQQISLDEIAFVGNDTNDLSCLTIVGLPIVVQDAHPDVIQYASYRTESKGGCGAVREICDIFERLLADNRQAKTINSLMPTEQKK